ncbi:MAG: DUF4424 family protein [Novosphingobium sp.]|nr:DUF4424 family protein [Novosphingobium sp.]MCP5403606.1 DUF4424 family protein [Novosphingobium sp.]
MKSAFVLPAFAALALATAPALANDSEAEIGIGGITLKPSDAIVMESEDLFVSEQIVRVKYRFSNPTSRTIETTVAFPMPPQPRAFVDRWYDMESKQDWSEFGFNTKVDGQPVRLKMIERAMVDGRDVTERIAQLGWPLYWVDEDETSDLFEDMDEASRARFVEEGLAKEDEMFGGRTVPAWDSVTFFVREQSFPAGSTVVVEHEYAPMNGGSVGGTLHKSVRGTDPDIMRDYKQRYCTDEHFLAGFDRRLEQMDQPGIFAIYTETWLSYVLSSGANWKGPIGDFRLVVDKGSTEYLVSFCMDGVRKIAPTQFEVRKTNFEPNRDLDILIVKFHEMEE